MLKVGFVLLVVAAVLAGGVWFSSWDLIARAMRLR